MKKLKDKRTRGDLHTSYVQYISTSLPARNSCTVLATELTFLPATGQTDLQTTGTAATASGMYPLATAETQQRQEQLHKLQEQRRQLQEQPPYLKKQCH